MRWAEGLAANFRVFAQTGAHYLTRYWEQQPAEPLREPATEPGFGPAHREVQHDQKRHLSAGLRQLKF